MLIKELNAIADALRKTYMLPAQLNISNQGNLTHFQQAIMDTAIKAVADALSQIDARFDRTRFLDRAGFYGITRAHLAGAPGLPFAAWLAMIESELATPVDPTAYRPYYDADMTPAEAIYHNKLSA